LDPFGLAPIETLSFQSSGPKGQHVWVIGTWNLNIVCYLLFGAWDFFVSRILLDEYTLPNIIRFFWDGTLAQSKGRAAVACFGLMPLQALDGLLVGWTWVLVVFFGPSQGGYDPVGKAENQGGADKDDEVGGKKGHHKNKGVFEVVG